VKEDTMTTYPVPGPVSALVELSVGTLDVVATDTDEVSVDVRPTNPEKSAHVRSAEQTRVELSEGRLVVRQPRVFKYSPFGPNASIEVTVRVPTGSRLEVDSQYGAVRAAGTLGSVELRTGYGDVSLDEVGGARVHTGYGAITARRIAGDAELTGSGRIRVDEIDGSATVKNKLEGTTIGVVTGRLEVNASYGEIDVDHALGAVAARTAYGRIRVGDVVRGTVSVDSSYGGLEVGIREGTAAWLDLSSEHGVVRNGLDAVDGPTAGAVDGGEPDEPVDTVEVRGRTKHGDILVRRARAAR
jgi:hypothetical protein